MHAPKQIQDSVSNLRIYACLFGVTVVNIKKDGDARSDMLFELCSEGGTVKACLSQKWEQKWESGTSRIVWAMHSLANAQNMLGSPRVHASLWHRWSLHVVFVCVSNLWGRAVGGRIVLNEGSSGCSIHKSRIHNARWEDRKTLTSLVVGVIGKHMVTSASWQKKISLVSHHSNVFLVNARVIITPTNLYYKCHCGLLWGLSSASWSSLTRFLELSIIIILVASSLQPSQPLWSISLMPSSWDDAPIEVTNYLGEEKVPSAAQWNQRSAQWPQPLCEG